MAPKLSGHEIDDLIFFARAGEETDLTQLLKELSERESVTVADILEAAKDDGKATCLHMAAANGHSKTVTHILSHLPPKPSKPQQNPSPPQQEGDAEQQPPPSYINAANLFGNTALHWACLGGHLDVVRLLLSRGASPALPNDKDQIPLDLAAFNNHMAVVEYFLDQSRNLEGDNAKEGGLDSAVGDVEMKDEDEEKTTEGEKASTSA
ncbi:ankyrin repeat-containing domain protein [Pseudomassariella vexata]|uniref:Ankyrin repeat-containing domain protein n=1 Tax=Pseudomassariella vexata TaxID=1141098 RepID=A0A1Y2EKT2_9PEZI|nr:ankyrin repeat-containing domain protein [Pseudomassariella vexata]ORY72152.1 ankyrin repeat-containing domain protein [Pseudomassariella vexata]